MPVISALRKERQEAFGQLEKLAWIKGVVGSVKCEELGPECVLKVESAGFVANA